MHERELYDRLLGLSAPWFVADVNLDTEAQQVDVFVDHAKGTSFCCPECGKQCPVYDHTTKPRGRRTRRGSAPKAPRRHEKNATPEGESRRTGKGLVRAGRLEQTTHEPLISSSAR